MTEWKTYKLGDIADIQTGPFGSQLHNKDYATIGSPIVTVEHLGNRRFTTQNLPLVSDTDKARLSKYVLSEGDIVFSRVGSVDRCSYVSEAEDGWLFSGRCLRVRCNEKAYPLYVYYYFCLECIKQYVRNVAVGATMPSINTQIMSEIPISLPGLEEQRRIAGILGTIDDKIECNRRINTNLESQAQALYKQWFVDFEFPNDEGKPYKSSGGKMVDSALGPIPEGWSEKGFCEVVDIKGGGTPQTNNHEYWTGTIPFFTPKDVSQNNFVIKTEKYITELGLANCSSKLYEKNTVFITARGTVGKIVMAGCPMAMNQTNYALIGKNGISQYFVYLSTIQLVDMLLKKANGAVFNAITTKDFEGEKIIYPNDNVLNSFVEIVSSIYEQILTSIIENERLATLRDTLLPKLMNGEIKI